MKHNMQIQELNDDDIEVVSDFVNEVTMIVPARDFIPDMSFPKPVVSVMFPPKPAMELLADSRVGLMLFIDEATRALQSNDMTFEQRSIITKMMSSMKDHVKQLDYVRTSKITRFTPKMVVNE